MSPKRRKTRELVLFFAAIAVKRLPLRSHWKASTEKVPHSASRAEAQLLLYFLRPQSVSNHHPNYHHLGLQFICVSPDLQMLLGFLFQLWTVSVKKEKALSSNTGKQDKQDILPMKKIRLYEKCKVHFFSLKIQY